MSTVEEILRSIESLAEEEYTRLREWFSERDWEKWDKQIEVDSESGKLDFLVKEAHEEVNEIIHSRKKFINRYYPSIRGAYKTYYGWPELDPLRHEICICIMLGLCQAAITLTNHLLESLLKYALIIKHSENKKIDEEKIKGPVVTSLIERFEECRRLYGDANLDTTINRACTLGIISKEQKKRLHECRERFRNAYSHSDKEKTFGDSSMPVTGVRFDKDGFKIDETCETKIAEFLPGQGIIQVILAQKEATPYFLYIDSLAREIIEKLFGPSNNSE